jgi:prenyl protein peptidase
VYRACMLPLLVPCFGVTPSIVICPLFFGVGKNQQIINTLKPMNLDERKIL